MEDEDKEPLNKNSLIILGGLCYVFIGCIIGGIIWFFRR